MVWKEGRAGVEKQLLRGEMKDEVRARVGKTEAM